MVRTANGPVLVITELTDLVFIVVGGDAGVFDVVSFVLLLYLIVVVSLLFACLCCC